MDPAQGAPEENEPQQGGGISQKIADMHSLALQVQEAVQAKFPEDAQQFAAIAQAIQSAADSLGQAPGQQQPQGVGTTTPEAGAAQVQQAM